MESVFVLSFEGDDDAVGSGGIAIAFLRELLSASVCGEIRVDSYMEDGVFQPSIQIIDGRRRELQWPRALIYCADLPALSKRVYLASFPYVKKGWGSYCHEIADKVASFKPDAVVLLGSIIATDRQPYFGRVLARSNSPKLMRKFGFSMDKCTGVTGILGAVHVILEGKQLSAASMWLTTPITEAHEIDVQGALELIEVVDGMFDFGVWAADLKFDADSVLANGAAGMSKVGADDQFDLWASQVDFMELRDLAADVVKSSSKLIEEAEEYLREIDD